MKDMLVLVFFALFLLVLVGCIEETGKVNQIANEEDGETADETDAESEEAEIEIIEKPEIAEDRAEEAEINLCGNGEIEEEENCSNCPGDVKCGEKEICIIEKCIGAVSVITTEDVKKVGVRIGTRYVPLAIGDLIIVEGRRSTRYSGEMYRIKLVAVVDTREYYAANFELQNAVGEKIAPRTEVKADKMLSFYDDETNEYLFNTLIWVVSFR